MKAISDEDLQQVEELAMLMFSKEEILLILELQQVPDKQITEFDNRYMRGRLKSEAEVRKSIFEHAKNGSSPAQTLAVKFIEDAKTHD